MDNHTEDIAPADAGLGYNLKYEGWKICKNDHGKTTTLSYGNLENISFKAPNYINPYSQSSIIYGVAKGKYTQEVLHKYWMWYNCKQDR